MDTYKIVRKYRDSSHPDNYKVIDYGLSLEEAQAHCNDPSTREPGVWFDCYYEEESWSYDRKPLPFMDKIFALQTKDPQEYLYRTR